MREYKIIAVLTALVFLVVAAYFFRGALSPGAGELDELAAHRIAATCAYQHECKVNLQDLFAGDWDTLWEFAPGVSQQQIDRLLPGAALHAPGRKRLVVLMHNATVAAKAYEPAGSQPVEHQLVFEDAAQDVPPIVHYPRNTWLWASLQPAAAGASYRLSPDNR